MFRLRTTALAIALFITTLLFMGVVNYDFVYDDATNIAANNNIQAIGRFGDWFSLTFWKGVFGAPSDDVHYQPAAETILAAAGWLGGKGPGGFHTFSLLLHLLNVSLVFIFASRFLQIGGAFVAALAFGIFPAHVEAVAGIRGIGDLAAASAGLLTFIFYFSTVGAVAEKTGRRALFLTLTFFASLFAFLSSETALALPAALVIFDFIVTKDWKPSRLVPLGSLIFACLVYFCFRLCAFGENLGLAAGSYDLVLPEWRYRTLRFEILRDFLVTTAYPFHHNAFRVFRVDLAENAPVIAKAWWTAVAAVASAILALLASLRWQVCKWPAGLFLLFLILLAPRLIFTKNLAEFSFSEQYLYFPSVAFVFLLGLGFDAIAKLSISIAYIPAVLLLGAYGFSTYERLPVWRDDGHFFVAAEADSPESSTVKYTLGSFTLARYQKSGSKKDLDAALERYKSIVSTDLRRHVYVPSRDIVRAYLDIASIRLIEGRAEDALSIYDQVSVEYPKFEQAYMLAGVALSQLGNYDVAEQKLKQAIALNPRFAAAHFNLGNLYIQRRMFANAAEALREAIRIEPKFFDAKLALATALVNDKKPTEAAVILQKMLDENPNMPGAEKVKSFLQSLSGK